MAGPSGERLGCMFGAAPAWPASPWIPPSPSMSTPLERFVPVPAAVAPPAAGRAKARRPSPDGAWSPRKPLPEPSLERCLLLAVLLHILVFIIVGTEPGGSPRRGEAFRGPLVVRLRT